MLTYLPASYVYTSRVSESDEQALNDFYMDYVLANRHMTSEDNSTVRTDFFAPTKEPWELFIKSLFPHFCTFMRECLTPGGTYTVRFRPCWFNYYATANSMNYHSHPETDFGVIYCLRNEGGQATRFHTFSHEYVSQVGRFPKIRHCQHEWKPKAGEFIFFPASLFHATDVATADGQRITLIANILVKKTCESENLSIRHA